MSSDGLGEVVWQPSPDRARGTAMARFLDQVAASVDPGVTDAASLWRWSVENAPGFWSRLWDFVDVIGEKGSVVVEDVDRMPGARWFPEARLNFAETLLRHRGDAIAMVGRDEMGRRHVFTRDELRAEVARCQKALVEAGVGVGDRVGAYMPNRAETVIAMLAATGLGAVWSSCSPDFGIQGALDRLGQIEPKVLVAADGYRYADKNRPVLDRVRALRAQLPSVQRVLLVQGLTSRPLEKVDVEDAVLWKDAVSARPAGEPHFEPLPFDHPVYVMYSSGTTGLPKAIVHGAGGTLLQHLKELVLHTDLRAGDGFAYYTTCGWMMWNWMVSGLAVGARIVLIDGSPFHPRTARLLDLVDDEDLAVLGTSAKWIAMAEKRGLQPRVTHELRSLRTILSTGSPLAPEGFDWVYRDAKDDVQLASISGGTDLISCFALGDPMGPVRRGELQMRGLGMKVEVFDDEGARLPAGEKGELVCTVPFPSMPVGFWNDPDGTRYRGAYFEHFENTWRHGDWVEITPHGGMVFHGRSDATLNPGGVRIGTAEIYRVVETFDEVLEAVVIGQDTGDDQRIVLFVRMAENHTLDDALRDRLRTAIRAQASPHHVPRVILAVDDVPRTVSGKISEVAVRKVVHGEAIDNREALANPESLDAFRERPELRMPS